MPVPMPAQKSSSSRAEFLGVFQESAAALPAIDQVYVIGATAHTGTVAGRPSKPFETLLVPRRQAVTHGTCRDIAAILFTSGTTGPSKGALLPHGHLYLNAKLYIDGLGVTAQDVIYCCLPLFHLNALTLQLYCALIVGCRIVIARAFSASAWLADIRRAGATVTNLLGTMTEFVLGQPQTPVTRTMPCGSAASCRSRRATERSSRGGSV